MSHLPPELSNGSLGLGADFTHSGHLCTIASTSFEIPGHQTEVAALRRYRTTYTLIPLCIFCKVSAVAVLVPLFFCHKVVIYCEE